MAEAAEKKPKTEYTAVQMTDGRTVQFAGKRKVIKETLIDTSKIIVEGDTIQMQKGAVSIRMDFLNGETRTHALNLSLLPRYAGHGAEQKHGDELASPADKPMSVEDMVIATDDLFSLTEKGEWGKGRAEGGGGVAGAAIVVLALIEATTPARTAKGLAPMTVNEVKAYIDGMLEKNPGLTRRALYDSFRVVTTKTGQIIKRMEEEKLAKTAKVDSDALLADMA